MTSLDQIGAMAALSTRMVEAAHANDWALLVELEQQLSGRRAELALLEPDGRQSERLSPAEARRKTELIEQILADCAEVMRHAQPFQGSVRHLLSASSMERSLRQAYALES